MKVAITSTGLSLESNISNVFGRSPNFIVADLENGKVENVLPIENPAKNERGAGNLAAQFIVDQGVEALIIGELGNVAFGILRNAGIKIYKISPGSVEKNIRYFGEGKLDEIDSVSSGFPGRGKSLGGIRHR
ncbi:MULTISPECIES: NifB/NifX family molybdenum-iron cluster-binding protein [Methanobacterium]|jgi:predicted Fe-Mo cluster-binding NifX family protein|uniref:NifB/NifX family molybdenum-iron cluster-binding protein n=1 Tax=Methanobacterium veterum TaxID=408577 RepID=A0A9E4ZYY1_9EURY|nr:MULTISPECIES: NifB/NifX family molybdenum-iron cluster-binding protein [Methanobacterium]MCZ3366558.1 NifB/NifX family molybdenum-iron cluster-binding protein [Methanobacterium veterum]MCZ3374298.1 NifB/NifX family molybdenum-iron cluster-binding protein [Methanobacterium veterum]